MKQKIFQLIIAFIVGGLGGVLTDQIFLPYLANVSPFSQIEFIRQAKNGTTIINRTEEIIITENTSLREAIGKVSLSLVVVQSWSGEKIIQEGTGFILFSDGLIITAADLASPKADRYLIIFGNEPLSAQVVRRDSESNLALLRIEKDNLPIALIGSLDDLNLGERIVLIGLERVENNFYQFINIGAVRSIRKDILAVNLSENNISANGGPLINARGEVVGLNLINKNGLVEIVSVNKIRELANQK